MTIDPNDPLSFLEAMRKQFEPVQKMFESMQSQTQVARQAQKFIDAQSQPAKDAIRALEAQYQPVQDALKVFEDKTKPMRDALEAMQANIPNFNPNLKLENDQLNSDRIFAGRFAQIDNLAFDSVRKYRQRGDS